MCLQLDEVRSSLAAAQSELLSAYKERGEAAEAKSKALEQLEVVRDNYAKQSAELEGAREEERRLRAEVQALREEVARMEAARNVHVKELQARQAEAQKAVDRASSLEDENRDLVERLLQMKDVEVQRMNEMNRLREDMVGPSHDFHIVLFISLLLLQPWFA